MCLAAAQSFRVSSVVYGAPDLRLGAIKTHIQLLDMVEHPFHTIDEVVPDVLSEESSTLLKNFFRRRRQSSSSKVTVGSSSTTTTNTTNWRTKLKVRMRNLLT